MTFRIEKPGFYRQRNGKKAEVLALRNNVIIGIDAEGNVRVWQADGKILRLDQSRFDLISVWDTPEYWVNRHEDLLACYLNRHEAMDAAGANTALHRLRLVDGKLVDVTGEAL